MGPPLAAPTIMQLIGNRTLPLADAVRVATMLLLPMATASLLGSILFNAVTAVVGSVQPLNLLSPCPLVVSTSLDFLVAVLAVATRMARLPSSVDNGAVAATEVMPTVVVVTVLVVLRRVPLTLVEQPEVSAQVLPVAPLMLLMCEGAMIVSNAPPCTATAILLVQHVLELFELAELPDLVELSRSAALFDVALYLQLMDRTLLDDPMTPPVMGMASATLSWPLWLAIALLMLTSNAPLATAILMLFRDRSLTSPPSALAPSLLGSVPEQLQMVRCLVNLANDRARSMPLPILVH